MRHGGPSAARLRMDRKSIRDGRSGSRSGHRGSPRIARDPGSGRVRDRASGAPAGTASRAGRNPARRHRREALRPAYPVAGNSRQAGRFESASERPTRQGSGISAGWGSPEPYRNSDAKRWRRLAPRAGALILMDKCRFPRGLEGSRRRCRILQDCKVLPTSLSGPGRCRVAAPGTPMVTAPGAASSAARSPGGSRATGFASTRTASTPARPAAPTPGSPARSPTPPADRGCRPWQESPTAVSPG